jgi:hypothetical protein
MKFHSFEGQLLALLSPSASLFLEVLIEFLNFWSGTDSGRKPGSGQ